MLHANEQNLANGHNIPSVETVLAGCQEGVVVDKEASTSNVPLTHFPLHLIQAFGFTSTIPTRGMAGLEDWRTKSEFVKVG